MNDGNTLDNGTPKKLNQIDTDDLARAYEQSTGKLYHACTECDCDPEYLKFVEREYLRLANGVQQVSANIKKLTYEPKK